MFHNNYIGIEITDSDVRLIKVKQAKTGVVVQAAETIQANFLAMDADESSQFLKEKVLPFCGAGSKVAVSMPDSTGRVLTTTTDAEWNSREEAKTVLKWQLKGDVAEIEKYRLDFQIVAKKENGLRDLVVALADDRLTAKVEMAFTEVNLHPVHIGLATLNCHNFFRHRLDLGENFIMLRVLENSFGVVVFQRHLPVMFRSVRLPFSAEGFFREMSRTKAALSQKQIQLEKTSLFLTTIAGIETECKAALDGVFARQSSILAPHFDLATSGENLPMVSSFPLYVAAAGTAEQFLR